MADAAVGFLLNSLKELLISHSHLITDTRSEIENLERDLRRFRALLRESLRKDELTQSVVRDIRDIVYEVEDTIDAFLTQVASKKPFHRFFKSPFRLRGIGEKVEELTKQIKNSKKTTDWAVDDKHKSQAPEPEESRGKLVGFEDVWRAVIGQLTEETETVDVITLVGVSGVGKTALAQKIFNHPEIKNVFETRIWFHESNDFTKKNFLLTILRKLSMDSGDVMGESDEVLTELVFSHLESRKFLIVLDDVWSISDWDILGIAQPESSSIKMRGKVLVTSCNEEVGRRANGFRQAHKVRPLSESESWELLELEVFGETKKCPPELEDVGKLIAKQCDGLPLAIVTVGGVLARDNLSSVDIQERKATWIRACESVPKYRNKKFYDNLPTHLELCFLYLAVFPYDFEIPVGQLIYMWIAEGFIEQYDNLSLEETAERYLEVLIGRNLLKICQMKDNGRVKTCRIDRMLHDVCKTEAGKGREDILTEIKFNYGVFEPPVSELSECRRLSIHSNVLQFVSSKPFGPRVRSLVSFSTEEFCLPVDNNSAILTAFKLLRVLDAKPIKFTKIPSDLYHLIHLRYLALSSSISVLPTAFSKLWNILTLIVDTTSRTLDVEPDILEWTQLRHFITNASANLCKTTSFKGKGGRNLQLLGVISPGSCTKELFDRVRDLKKLGIRGKLSLLLEGKSGSVEDLATLDGLEILKLLNDVYPLPASGGRLHSLPTHYKFPPNLKSLTLAGTYLDWSQMSILGLLKKLEVLKLKDRAFVGQIWEVEDGGFRNLEALHIARTDLVIWVASVHHFPQLRSLKLRHCQQLQEVPTTLADIPNLRLLELFETKLAAASAKTFLKLREMCLKEQGMDAKDFKLSVYP